MDMDAVDPVYTQDDIDQIAKRKISPPPCSAIDECRKNLKPGWDRQKCFAWWRRRFPVVTWLPQYDLKANLVNDLVAGITVGIMLIPQSMAYGTLAGLDASHGLYTSFYPGCLYFLFGSSRHVSLGVFAVVSMMVASVRYRLSPVELDEFVLTNSQSLTNSTNAGQLSPFEVVASLTFATGVISVILAMLKAGFLSMLISDQVSGGFTTGAAVHVLSAQLGQLLGLTKLKRHSGAGKLVFLFYDLLTNIVNSHWPTSVMSVVSFIVIFLLKEVLNPIWMKRSKMGVPIPSDMILIIVGTVASHFLQLRNRGFRVVGFIPSGFTSPVVPNMSLLPSLLLDALVLCIVCYCVSISLAQIFAKKFHYEVDADQELLALGITQLFSSFFGCIAPCAAMGRTMVLVSSGGKTQVCSLFASFVVLLVILWIGRLLEALPECVLSVIIIVALKGIFKQFSCLPVLWKTSKSDYSIWLLTFLATVVLDIALGLAVGVSFAFLLFGFKFICQRIALMGSVPGTNIYLDKREYEELVDVNNVVIAQWDAPLFYANAKIFENEIFAKLKQTWLSNPDESKSYKSDAVNSQSTEQLRFLILDCSKVNVIDTVGLLSLIEVIEHTESYRVTFYLACCSGHVRRFLMKNSRFRDLLLKVKLFPTIHDAVQYAQKNV